MSKGKISIRQFFSMTVVALALVSEVSAGTYYVDQRHPTASDSNPGSVERPFKTISAAAAVAGPGDRVTVRPGIYREQVAPAVGGAAGRPVIYQADPALGAVVRGSEMWTPSWRTDAKMPGLYYADLPDDSRFPGKNPFKTRLSVASTDKGLPARPADAGMMLLPYCLGQLYVDGLPLVQVQTVAALRMPGSWTVTPDGRELVVRFPVGTVPERSVMEMTVRDRLFVPVRRGQSHIEVRGFIFEHCANQGPFPQRGAVSTRSGHHWVIENNIIRFAQTIGLDCGSEYWKGDALVDVVPEDRRIMIGKEHYIAGNLITDNGLCGIAGWNHSGTKIIGNVLERNNRLSLSSAECRWEEWAAIKLHGSNALIEGNLVRNNGAYGIWIDNGYTGARITRNVLSGNKGAGIFLELGAGRCLIDRNIVFGTIAMSDFYDGFGIYAHDASGLVIAHNLLLYNASAAVRLSKVSNRKFGGKPTEISDETIVNNIFAGNGRVIDLPWPNQFSARNVSDANLIVGDAIFRFSGGVGEPKIDEMLKLAKEKADTPSLIDEVTVMGNTRLVLPGLWRKLFERDVASVVIKDTALKFNYKPFERTLAITVNDGFSVPVCRKVDGVTVDFNGVPLPEQPTPGPFQNLCKGENYFSLWPVP